MQKDPKHQSTTGEEHMFSGLYSLRPLEVFRNDLNGATHHTNVSEMMPVKRKPQK